VASIDGDYSGVHREGRGEGVGVAGGLLQWSDCGFRVSSQPVEFVVYGSGCCSFDPLYVFPLPFLFPFQVRSRLESVVEDVFVVKLVDSPLWPCARRIQS